MLLRPPFRRCVLLVVIYWCRWQEGCFVVRGGGGFRVNWPRPGIGQGGGTVQGGIV